MISKHGGRPSCYIPGRSRKRAWGAIMRRYLMAITIGCGVMVLSSTLSLAGDAYPLTDKDCVKCHLQQVRDVDERGGLHKTEVGCLDCHEEHSPRGKNTIASCSRCHEPAEHAHYSVKNCIACHYPHYPMEMDLARIDAVKPACVSCHPAPETDMNRYPGEHARMDCKECHPRHGESTACGECHDPHADGMAFEDCLMCHQPHRPAAIEFAGAPPAGLCSSCHPDAVQEITDRGGAHEQVGCVECHLQHPPSEADVIPECAMCHSPGESNHYGVGNCGACHYPHYPLEIDYKQIASVKPVCLSCHPEPGRQMKNSPSGHGALDCKQCHADHAQSSECMQCHEPHSAAMSTENCFMCHQPHSPAPVAYTEQVPNSFCVCCHDRPGVDLSRTPTAHRALACIYCHQKQHTNVVECRTCHGQPHASDLHAKYPDCLRCHQDPHALIR